MRWHQHPAVPSLFMPSGWIVYAGLWKQYCKLVYNKQFPSGILHHNKAQMGRRELAVGAQQPAASASHYKALGRIVTRKSTPGQRCPCPPQPGASGTRPRRACPPAAGVRPASAARIGRSGQHSTGGTSLPHAHQLTPPLLRACCKPSATALNSTPPAPTSASASATAGLSRLGANAPCSVSVGRAAPTRSRQFHSRTQPEWSAVSRRQSGNNLRP